MAFAVVMDKAGKVTKCSKEVCTWVQKVHQEKNSAHKRRRLLWPEASLETDLSSSSVLKDIWNHHCGCAVIGDTSRLGKWQFERL